mgnify:CR=1 FL=1
MTSTVPLERYCPACGAANEDAPSEDARCFACGELLDHAPASTAPVTGERLAPGDLLHGRYRVINQVGTGGYGAVYRARDTLNGDKAVAIKAIHLRGLKPQEAIEATDTFNREISLLTGLSHSNLPRISDHFTDAAHWFLVMDFIEGETLEDYVRHTTKTGQLQLSEVLDIGIQLCTVLEYLHTRQPPIIFRDVKPANIMRAKRGHLYVIDFGIARRHKPGQRTDTIALGSPGYAAPEQYGRAQTTARADIYSLGVTLHQLLTGHDPAETPFHLPELDSFQLFLPPELIALIERMLDLDASRRPESMAEVKQTLRRVAAAQLSSLAPLPDTTSGQVYYLPPNTPATGKMRQTARTKQRASGIVSGGLAVVVLLALIAGTFSYMTTVHSFPHGFPGSLPPPASLQVLRIGVVNNGSALSLDPALANDPQANLITSLLFVGLTVQANDSVYPALAQSWQASADELTWTFHLRPNLRFSGGAPLTSIDMAYSLNRALSPATHSPTALADLGMIKDAQKLHAGKLRTLIGDSILTPDPQTIVIKLAVPDGYLATALAAPAAAVVEQSMVKRYGERYFTQQGYSGTSGAFQVQQQDSAGMQFVPNPSYYGTHPKLLKIVLLFYQHADESYDAYQNAATSSANAVDLTPVPLDKLNQARTATGNFEQIPQPTLYYYGMNYLEQPFDNISIRQAFALALNKDAIAQDLGDTFSTNHLIPTGVPGSNPTLNGPDGQNTTSGGIQQAKTAMEKGLQQEGWSSVAQIPPITFTYAADSPQQTGEINAAVQMWRDVLGVTVQPRRVSSAALIRAINATVNNPRGLQMWASSWQAAYADAQQWTSLPFSAGSPFNAVNYGQNHAADAAAQQAVQQALAATDSLLPGSNRDAQYSNAEQQLVNDVAWIPVSQDTVFYLAQPYVENSLSAMESPIFWSNVFITQH